MEKRNINCEDSKEKVTYVRGPFSNLFKNTYSPTPLPTRVIHFQDLLRICANFHNIGLINQSANSNFIVFVPKKNANKISDFKPINLVTSPYKNIAKGLSCHIQGFLHETIHLSQGAFVYRRQILDVVLVANERVDEKRQY